MPCKCDNNACGSCICSKSNTLCTKECHGGRDISSIPCLNTEQGKKVKSMSIKDIRDALCAHSLSPIGDKSELMKRLADFFSQQSLKGAASGKEKNDKNAGVETENNKELLDAIIEAEGDYVFVLSLSGKKISATSSKPDLRRAYLLLSTKAHPDKNPGVKEANEAFQIVLDSYERLCKPEKFEDEEEESGPAKKRQKAERFTRSNDGCFKTKVKCPRCKQTWGVGDLGLEDAAYNFFMLGIKQYFCGRCACEFGCMTAFHFCPKCDKVFEYDPDDYHRKITCGNAKCTKEFGFWQFKVSQQRENEVRLEVKKHHEEQMKKIAQKKRRAARADKRVVKTDADQDELLQEKLFVIGLRNDCPRCGWEMTRHDGKEEARQHLDECTDQSKIKEYKLKIEKEKKKLEEKQAGQESQFEVQAVKQWEQNGRQVGQLWMLSDRMLEKQCTLFSLETTGPRHELIARLAKHLRSKERLMITDGKTKSTLGYDTVSIVHADEEDLPKNIHELEKEELRDLCASYNIKFEEKDVKADLIKKFEKARMKGKEVFMICDKESDDDDDEKKADKTDKDYQVESE